MAALSHEAKTTHYTVKLTTKGGTVYTYESIAALSPSDAGNLVCANWQDQFACSCTDLRQIGEHQWESANPDGVLVQIWES